MADLKDEAYWDTAILRAAGRLLMLATLGERPGHGYDVARRLSALCGEWCRPSPAMIYPALRELEAAGLVVCAEECNGARRRRVCTLTAEGAEALEVGARVWERFLPAIQRVMASRTRGSDSGVSAAGCGPAGGE